MVSAISQASVGKANSGSEGASAKRSDLRWMSNMLSVAIGCWPRKTAQNLAAATHVSERAAEFWLAGKYDMSLAAARELLRSEQGFEYLAALVGEDCEALWFQRCKIAHEVGVTRRKIRAEEKRFEALKAKQQQLSLKLEDL